MEGKHAAGPWEFDPLLGEISSSDNAMIAQVYEPGDFPCAEPGVYTEEEYRANGALLAAAPTMADAIRAEGGNLLEWSKMGVSLGGTQLSAIARRLLAALPKEPDGED